MSKITSYTKPYIDALERRVIVGGQVSSNGNLKLINGLGEEIDAGNVQGDIPDRLQDIDDYLNSEEHKKTQVPKSPTMLTELQNEAYYSTAGPMAKVTLGWIAPTEDVYDQPIVVTEYRVYINNAEMYRVVDPQVEFELQTDRDVDIFVVAGTEYGVWSDPSDTVNLTGAKPLYEAATPTAPTLSSSLGSVTARWDGQYVEGTSLANSYIVVHAKLNAEPSFIVGSILTSQPIPIPNTSVGDLVEVWFVAFDKLNRQTGVSVANTIDVTGIDLPDLSDAVNDFLDDVSQTATEAQTAANSKNAVWYLDAAPAGTNHKVGDTWFDTDNDNQINKWDGSAWVPKALGTNAIADAAITNAKILDATIQNAKIANLDAAKITTGFLAADRIQANTITGTHIQSNTVGAEKLMVADLSNMATVSESVPGTAAFANWTSTVVDGWAARSVNTDTYFMFRRQHGPLPFKTGERIRVTFEAYADVAVNAELTLWTYPEGAGSSNTFPGGNIALTTTPQLFERELTVTAPTEGKTSFLIGLQQLSNRDVRLRNVRAYRMGAGELIVDGSVKAAKILADEALFEKIFTNALMAGRIVTDHLEASVGSSLNITANGSITLISQQQDNLSSEISDVVDTLTTVQQDVTTAAQEATAASAAAAIADGKALVAQNAADAAAAGISSQQAVFVVTPTGADIRSKDTTNIVRILPDGVSIIQGGVAVSTWDGARFISNEIITNQMQLANHKIEKSGTRTVFRAL